MLNFDLTNYYQAVCMQVGSSACCISLTEENMKRKISLLLFAVMLVAALLVCCACTEKPQDEVVTLDNLNLAETQAALIIKGATEGEYAIHVVEVSQLGAEPNGETLLNHFVNAGSVTVVWEDSDYGKYMTGINGMTPADQQFISVYTSVEADKGEAAWAKNIQLGNYVVTTSAVGISSAKVQGGSIIYLQIESY